MTGEGDYNANDVDDLKKKGVKPSAKKASAATKRKSVESDSEDEDDDEQQENVSPNTARRQAIFAAKTSSLLKSLQHQSKNAMALANGEAPRAMEGGSPKRFLSPQSLRFLMLPAHERARVLQNHSTLAAKRDARRKLDTLWPSREALYDAALMDRTVSIEQREVLQKVFSGASVFFTGSAGTGKSFLIHKILACLPGVTGQRTEEITTYATSTTGITAMNIQGQTIFAWAGLGALGASQSVDELVARVMRNRETLQRWRCTRSLLIDEISMLDGKLFEKLESVARKVRGNAQPFGGIQLILCGDFLQLPPVSKSMHGGSRTGAAAVAAASSSSGSADAVKFCFEAACWSDCIAAANIIELGQVFRQKDDAFVSLLDSLRRGVCTPEHTEILRGCEDRDLDALAALDGIQPTSLMTLKKEVDSLNLRELGGLRGETKVFHAKDSSTASIGGMAGSSFLEQLQSNCPARSKLELKIGAQVILLRNLSLASGLANGSRGVVLRFAPTTSFPVVRFTTGAEVVITPETWSVSSGGRVVASREQLPLDLAWALSIHKSQGMTLDRARIHLSNVFEFGQAYVALSRCRSLQGMELRGFHAAQIKAHPRVVRFYEELGEQRAQMEAAAAASTKARSAKISPNTLRRLQAREEAAEQKSAEKRNCSQDADDEDDEEEMPRRRLHFAKKRRVDEEDDEKTEAMPMLESQASSSSVAAAASSSSSLNIALAAAKATSNSRML